MRLAASLTVCGVLAVASSTTLAESAPDGVALFEQARFEEAQVFFEGVLADPAASGPSIARAHAYLGALRLIARDEEAAMGHVYIAVALDPEMRSPPGSPPRLEALIANAARARPEGRMRVDVEIPAAPVAGAPVHVRASASGAPEGLVSALELRCSCGDSEMTRRTEQATIELDMPTPSSAAGQQLSCSATARTESGAELLAGRSESTLTAVAPPDGGATVAPTAEERQRRRRLWLGIGIGSGAAVVVAAVIVGVVVGTRPDQAFVGTAGLDDQ